MRAALTPTCTRCSVANRSYVTDIAVIYALNSCSAAHAMGGPSDSLKLIKCSVVLRITSNKACSAVPGESSGEKGFSVGASRVWFVQKIIRLMFYPINKVANPLMCQ